MRNLLLLCMAVFSFGLAHAQDCTGADHTVLAGSLYYNPSTLTITAGETIAFLNENGFHNVNGVSSTLGDTWNNPETFSLGANSGAPGGVCMGTVTLNTPGTYQYDCSIGSHAAGGMVGTIIVEAATATTSAITFTVDVPANITVAADGMHIAGEMTGWTGEVMTDNGDGSWSKTYDLEDGDVTFKFQNGLGGWESTPDRTFTVAGADAEYSACWETTLAECPGLVDVTFQVDMNNANLDGSETIYVSGNFDSWCGNCNALADADADGIYTGTLQLGMTSSYEFKYLINGWGGEEQDANLIGTSCDWVPNDAYGNRGFAVGDVALTLPVVCYNFCGTCAEQDAAGNTDPTGPTDNATDPTQDANDVASIYGGAYASIATNYNPFWGQSGSVNTDYDPGTGNLVLEYANFNYQGTEITPTDLSSMTHLHVDVWVAEGTDRQLKVTPVNNGGGTPETLVNVPLTPGSWNSVDLAKADFTGMTWDNVFQMKFDGQFNGDGSGNTAPWTVYIDNLYFYNDGSGDNGGGGDPGDGGTEMVDVTWNVNMANVATAADGVYVAGGADFGAPGTNPMTDTDGDDVWTLTVQVPVGYSGYYTFTNGACADYSCKEDIAGQACADAANYNDRQLVNITENTVINTCFGECTTDGSCTPVVVGDPLVATLDVSCSGMTDITDVRIFGPFWNWDPAGGPVATLNADGLYEVVFDPAPDANMEYKWLINGEQEDLLDFSDEDLDGDGYNDFLNADCVPITDYFSYANRQWTVGSGNIADTWSQCAPCPAGPDSVLVTITVDMSEESVNPIGVFVAGTFQDWSPGTTVGTDNGDGTWSYSFYAAPGTEVQYKWLNGTDWPFEENVPTDCRYADTNRGFVVPNEDYSHPVHCFSSCNPCGAATYAATFTVLTDNITVAADGMHIAGAFEGWNGTAMTDNGDGSWSITIDLETGSYEFKFQNGLGGWEELDCGGNRSVAIDGSGAVSYTGCFAQCGESTSCATDPDPANITFRVDMSEVTDLIADSVYMIGGFTDPVWQAGAILMDDADGDLVYEATVLVSGPASIAYKFFNGNPYPNGQGTEVGGETADFAAGGCGVDNGVGGFNRTHDRTGADEVLDIVCFNSCAACGDVPLEGTEVTFSVDMNNYSGTFGFVNVSGTWNDFCGDCNQMTDDNSDGIWTTTITLPEGENYRYKYQLDGWVVEEDLAPGDNPIGACVVKQGGFTNRDLDVMGTEAIALDVVCWNSCQACIGDGDVPGCNDDTASNYDAAATANDGSCIYDVTFSVNMNEYALAAGDTVYVNGEFNGWCGECNPMADDDADGVWTVTLPLTTDYYEYKFTVNGWSADENLAGIGSCVTENFGFTNRVLQLFGNQAQPVVCWASCSNCEGTGEISGCTDINAVNYAATATSDDGTCQYNVTFSVDMTPAMLGDGDVAYVNGSFNSWCGDCNPMSDDDMDGVWTVTLPLPLGDHDYKFTINGWSMQEELPVGGACDFNPNDGFANRGFTLGAADLVLDVACYNSCYACDVVTGCTDQAAQNYDGDADVDDGSCAYIVTLRLDMSQQEVSPNGVHVAGSFQNWDPAGTPMTSPGLGLYEYTLQLSNGAHQFIYINGNAWEGQETVPAECGADNGLGGYNREVVVDGADMVLNVVCFNSCTACSGCTDPLSLEFSPFAGEDDGSCDTPLVFGCTYQDADNYNPAANMENGTCEFTGGSACPTDIDGDGSTAVGDLLIILGSFGQTCE